MAEASYNLQAFGGLDARLVSTRTASEDYYEHLVRRPPEVCTEVEIYIAQSLHPNVFFSFLLSFSFSSRPDKQEYYTRDTN